MSRKTGQPHFCAQPAAVPTTGSTDSGLDARNGWAGRRTHLSRGGATLLSSHAGRSFTPDAGKTYAGQPEGDSEPMSQTSDAQDPTSR